MSRQHVTPGMIRVLVLDDEQAVLDVLSDYLCAEHIELYLVREIEGAEALLNAMFFDVVVSDLRVSELGGLEGMRLIRYVATHYPNITVLAMSGYVTSEVIEMGQKAGAQAILEKPLDLRKLRAHIENVKNDSEGVKLKASQQGFRTFTLEPFDEFLEKREIRTVVQPIVDLQHDGSLHNVFACECLARGPQNSPLANPEILFAYASRKQRLFETDLVCIDSSLQSAQGLNRGLKTFVNLEPRSMTHKDFVPIVVDLVESFALEKEQVVWEITEQETILNLPAFDKSLELLRKEGFQIALDDFGQGFSNLHLLKSLMPDYLKISGLFSLDIASDKVSQAIMQSSAEMAERLRIPTIAEGVETQADMMMLRSLGVTYAQGYYFARPAPVRDFIRSKKFVGII